MSEDPQTVLIVDDNESVRSLLSDVVRDLGATSVEAENGVSALAHARQAPPDLILLDVDMPIMDGRAALGLLKQDPALRVVPVIVISATDETDVAVECIGMGAEDYVTKPFNTALLQARIRSTLERARLRSRERLYQQQAERYGLELEERVRRKTLALVEAEHRLSLLGKAKDDFLAVISHELRTPATGVLGASETLSQVELHDAGRKAAAEMLRQSVERLLRIIEDALLLTSLKVGVDEFSLGPHQMQPILANAVARASRVADVRGVRFQQAEGDAGSVLCEERMLAEALRALLECAVKFSARDRVVQTRCSRSGDLAQVSIRAAGRQIPPQAIPKFFEVFSLAEPVTPGGDLGLGPAVAEQILRLLGGSVVLEATEDGIKFVVSLRAASPPETVGPAVR